MRSNERRTELIGVGLILALAAMLRLWSISYDLPYVFHPDEPAVVDVAVKIVKNGDFNPHFFHYPSLVFYVHAAGYALYYALGRAGGAFNSLSDLSNLSSLVMGTTVAPDPAIVLIGRGITLALGLGSVLLVYLAGRALTQSRAVGALAAFFMAISPTFIYHSRIITPDTFVTFFALVVLYFTIRLFHEGKTWHYVAAAVAVGLTAGSKYNGVLSGILPVAAHFLRDGRRGWRDWRLYAMPLLSGLVFLLTTPYSLLDYPAFSEALAFDATHYATGHAGMEGDTVRWYLGFLWQTTTVLPLLALIQVARGLLQRSKTTALLASFPIVYILFISRFIVRNDRTLLPALPFLFLLAAILLVDWYRRAIRVKSAGRRWLATAAVAILVLLLVAQPLRLSIAENAWRDGEQTLPTAANWINDNLPAGSKVAIESYGPFIDASKFTIQPFDKIIDSPPEWYVAEGYNYLIVSRARYGRYFLDPQRYAGEVAQYENIFRSFHLVNSFSSERAEIRIYRVLDES